MLLKKSNFITVFLVAIVFASAYFKEVFFEIVNAELAGSAYNYANTQPPSWMLSQSHQQLIKWKWIVLFINFFILNIVNVIYLRLNNNKLLLRIFLFFMASMFVGMVVSFISFVFLKNETFMTISRAFQTVIESPFTILVLILIHNFPQVFFKKQL